MTRMSFASSCDTYICGKALSSLVNYWVVASSHNEHLDAGQQGIKYRL